MRHSKKIRLITAILSSGMLLQQAGAAGAVSMQENMTLEASVSECFEETMQTETHPEPEVSENLQTEPDQGEPGVTEDVQMQSGADEPAEEVPTQPETSVPEEIQTEPGTAEDVHTQPGAEEPEEAQTQPDSGAPGDSQTQSETSEPEEIQSQPEEMQTEPVSSEPEEVQTEPVSDAAETEQTQQESPESESETETAEQTQPEAAEAVPVFCRAFTAGETALFVQPDKNSRILVRIPANTLLYILSETSAQGTGWAQVLFALDETGYEGYVLSHSLVLGRDDSPSDAVLGYEDFPADYQALLAPLQEKHPNWSFRPVFVNDTYDYAVSQQMEPARALVSMYYNLGLRSLLPRDYSWQTDSWKQWEPGWAGASEATVRHYMDPRNFLDETEIFMFETLTYEEYQTEEAVEAVLAGSFMSHTNVPDEEFTYAWLFVWIGQKYNINPVSLASRVRQEQGAGTSELISGTYPGYEGLYNYFNIQATGSTRDEIVTNGLKEAQKGSVMTLPDDSVSEGAWDTHTKALIGGAMKFASMYILRNQNTLYAQKFDYDPEYNGTYWHQYMTNIMAPYAEGGTVGRSYQSMDMQDEAFVFLIPIYKEMPASSPKPADRKAFNSCLQSMIVNGKELITEFDRNQKEFICRLDQNTEYAGVAVKASSASASLFYRNPGTMKYSVAVCDIIVTAEDQSVAEYRLILTKDPDVPSGFFDNFDADSYRRRYPQLNEKYGDDMDGYYEHYLKIGYPQGWDGSDDGKTTEPLIYPTVYQGVNYAAVYQMDYYLAHNSDVKAAFGSDPQLVLQHFIQYGIREGRKACPDFDIKIYQMNYSDLRQKFGDNRLKYVQHYIQLGMAECRNARELLYLAANGLQQDEYGNWYYYVNGRIDRSYQGLAELGGSWFYVKDGAWDDSYTGFVTIGKNRYYVEDGVWVYEKYGLVKVSDKLYYVESGILNETYAGLTNYQKEWYYVTKGTINKNYTGLTEFCGAWYYIQNGELKWLYDGLVEYQGFWYYVENSMIQWNHTGLVKQGSDWVYVEKSMLKPNFTGVVKHNQKLYYVEKGKLKWNYTGLASYQNKLYYMVNSVHKSDYSGLVQYRQTWYYVKAGVVDSSFTGLIKSGSNLYYIRNGSIDWNYNGKAVYNGVSYQVRNGMVRL